MGGHRAAEMRWTRLYAVEEEDLGMMRYAADDRPAAAAFSGGDYRVDVRVSEEGVLPHRSRVRPGRASRSTPQVLNPNQAMARPRAVSLGDYSGRERVLTR